MESMHDKCPHFQINILSVMKDILFIGGQPNRMLI
jgi:hypothetical protein